KALESRNQATLNPKDNPILLGYSIWGNIANLSGGFYHPPTVSEIVEKASEEFNPMIIAKQELIDLYCPLRIIRDSIYIFNFDKDSIYVFTPENNFKRTMPLIFDVHKLKYCKRDILVNDEGTECYFKFEVRGADYIQKIDLNTGKAASTAKLGEQFPNKIRILGGYVYYTCTQEGEYKNYTVHLYRQKL
ncbi:MAG: hypothetical protein KGJ07_10155, partial [Patescibacteria group bacterium]|nr:hypothetical protein [Patescibacteria group bacterium]